MNVTFEFSTSNYPYLDNAIRDRGAKLTHPLFCKGTPDDSSHGGISFTLLFSIITVAISFGIFLLLYGDTENLLSRNPKREKLINIAYKKLKEEREPENMIKLGKLKTKLSILLFKPSSNKEKTSSIRNKSFSVST